MQLDSGQRPLEQIIAGLLFTTTGRAVTRAELNEYAIRRGRSARTKCPAASSPRLSSSAAKTCEVAA